MSNASVINLDNLWVGKYYKSHAPNTPMRNGKTLPDWRFFIGWYLRYLIFCDQCHDFTSNDERNHWYHNKEEIGGVYRELKKLYYDDLIWVTGRLGQFAGEESYLINHLPPELNPESLDLIYWNTSKMVEHIDGINKYYLNITAQPLSTNTLKNSSSMCANAAKNILDYVSLSKGSKTNSESPIIIAIDADKSRFKLCSLLHYMCEKIADDKTPEGFITLLTMAATNYDAATTSGTEKFIKTVKNLTDKNKLNIVDNIHSSNIEININNITLISYSTNKKQSPARPYGFTRDQFTPLDLNKGSLAFNYARENNVDMKNAPYTKAYKAHWTPSDVRAQEKRNSETTVLNISQFYSRNVNSNFYNTNNLIDSTNASVSSITKSYPLHDENGNVYIDSLDAIYYKTFGDFGQIAEYKTITDTDAANGIYYKTIFITFDEICSRISCLFNRFTVCESQKEDLIIAPLIVFEHPGLQDIAASLLELADVKKADVPTTGARTAAFGKKPKVSIRNTSTKVLKAKLKLVGIPLSKVIRGKSMKLTRKQLEMRAEAFKKLQMRCQKRGISLTYVSKKGRKYKSVKRLLSDMKRKPKTKPKTKKKSKMKWG